MATIAPGLQAARFRLENHLTFLALPDPQAPVFAYQTWFRVGSRHEKKGKTGIAHLFEHLMFKGTKTHPTGEFDKEMELRGAQTNAATWVDWTYYREALPALADNFEVVVGYEADRMVNLALSQAMVDSEREVVKNERRQRVDNSVHGTLDELTYRTAYADHPYGHPTIGYMEDLNSMTMAEFEEFYRTFYAPNNAIVVVVGALELERIVATIARAYGPLPAQAVPALQMPKEPMQKEMRRAEMKRATDSERISIVFHAPAQDAEEHAVLQVAAEVLCGGETGRIYQDLVVEKEWCQDVHASITPYQEPGLFQLDLSLKPDESGDEAEKRALEHLVICAKKGVTDREVEKAKNRIESAFLRALTDVDGKAEQIGHFETTAGDAGFVLTVLERLRKVTPLDVKKTVAAYLNPAVCTIVRVRPDTAAA